MSDRLVHLIHGIDGIRDMSGINGINDINGDGSVPIAYLKQPEYQYGTCQYLNT